MSDCGLSCVNLLPDHRAVFHLQGLDHHFSHEFAERLVFEMLHDPLEILETVSGVLVLCSGFKKDGKRPAQFTMRKA